MASTYETSNVDLASFLLLEGISLDDCFKSDINPKVVIIRFKDPQGRCIDLEMVFARSAFKQYRDINKQLLSRIHGVLRS